MINLKKENGGIALYVTFTMIILIISLTMIYAFITNKQVAQLEVAEQIKNIYKVDDVGFVYYTLNGFSSELSLQEVVSQLENDGYEIYASLNNVTGITFDEENVFLYKNDSRKISVFCTGDVQYYLIVNGNYYLLMETENGVEVSKDASNTPQSSISLTASSDNSIITVGEIIRNRKIVLNSGNTLESSTITVTCASNTETCSATVVDGISDTTSYVGYYADIDGDDTPDGIIYADLAIGGSGEWGQHYRAPSYSYAKVSDVKTLKIYCISQESYNGVFGTKPVLKAIGTGRDRFYVMALEDCNPGTYYNWYYNAYEKLNNKISSGVSDFGKGKSNTKRTIAKWNQKNSSYGAKNGGLNYTDLWEIFIDINNPGGTVDSDIWFVPSSEEWCAFGNNLGITGNNYVSLGLCKTYWSVSEYNDGSYFCFVYTVTFDDNYYHSPIDYDNVRSSFAVRLSTTF